MARETQTQLKARIRKILARMRKANPDAHCALNFSNPLELLVATILSAQTTDKGVNVVTAGLFKKYRTAADYANANIEEFQQEIRATGFYRNKAKSVMAACRRIVDEFGGNVPDTMEGLLTLPGVARKTANVVLGNAFSKNEGIAVDRHVARVSGRLGLAASETPEKIEAELMALVPREDWCRFSHQLIDHGRGVCAARKPNCAGCLVNDLCLSAFKVS